MSCRCNKGSKNPTLAYLVSFDTYYSSPLAYIIYSEVSNYMYTNQQDAQISVIKLYFLLDALHVSDYISPSSGATFYKLYIAFGIFGYVCGYNHRCIQIYQMRCITYKRLLLMMD